MKLVLLGSPGALGDPTERWHDDVYDGAVQLGWDVSFLRARDCDTDDIVRAARGADMLLWMRTHDYNIRGGDGRVMLRRVERGGTATAGMHFDLYWGLYSRQQRIGREPWWSAQHVFTADGGQRAWASRGVNHHWLPPGFGTRYLGCGVRSARARDYAAVFVGSNISGIHTGHRSAMLTWARRTWGPRFRHVGAGRTGKVYGHALNDLYACTELVLGESVPAPRYWSDRLPRTLGRGALLAYPHTEGLDEWGFTDDVMIRFPAGQFAEILARLRQLSPEDRERMRDNGITLVRERHLWRHRLQHIAEVVFDGSGDRRGGGAAGEVGQLPGGALASGPG